MVPAALETITSVQVDVGATEATMTVLTVDDSAVEDDSVVTATIQTDSDYTVGTASSFHGWWHARHLSNLSRPYTKLNREVVSQIIGTGGPA